MQHALKLIVSNGMMDSEEIPQTMFYKFGTMSLDIGGMHSADVFRRAFLGINPLHRLGICKCFRHKEDIILIIMKHARYSCAEAEEFIKKILGKEIRYMENAEKEKYFTLHKKRGAETYYFIFFTRKKIYSD